jgi:hypothetical protein
MAADQMIDALVVRELVLTMTAPLPPGPGLPRDPPSKYRMYWSSVAWSVLAGSTSRSASLLLCGSWLCWRLFSSILGPLAWLVGIRHGKPVRVLPTRYAPVSLRQCATSRWCGGWRVLEAARRLGKVAEVSSGVGLGNLVTSGCFQIVLGNVSRRRLNTLRRKVLGSGRVCGRPAALKLPP